MHTLLKLDRPSCHAYIAGFLVFICGICLPAVAEDENQPVPYTVECAEGGVTLDDLVAEFKGGIGLGELFET